MYFFDGYVLFSLVCISIICQQQCHIGHHRNPYRDPFLRQSIEYDNQSIPIVGHLVLHFGLPTPALVFVV